MPGIQGNAYSRLTDLLEDVMREFPTIEVETRSLLGTRVDGDQLVIERTFGANVRWMRVPASQERLRAFGWGHASLPGGDAHAPGYGEGTTYGTLDYFRYFLREFLFLLRPFESIPRWQEGWEPPGSVDDFYLGFEGEPEISIELLSGSAVRRRVRLWQGHFDAVMRHATPGPSGWTGLALPYHLHSARYENPWELPRADLPVARAQWADLGASVLGLVTQAAHAAVLRLFLEAESDVKLCLRISYW